MNACIYNGILNVKLLLFKILIVKIQSFRHFQIGGTGRMKRQREGEGKRGRT